MTPLDQLNAGMKEYVTSLTRSRSEAQGVQSALSKANTSLLSLGKAVGLGAAFAAVKSVGDWATTKLKGLTVDTSIGSLREQRSLLATYIKALDDYKKNEAKGDVSRRELARLRVEKEFAQFQIKNYSDRLRLSQAIQVFTQQNRVALVAMSTSASLLASAFTDTLVSARSMNMALVASNADFKMRYDLMTRILKVQQATGASSQTLQESAAALVNYGNELSQQFDVNVRAVSLLRDGLGVSAQQSAEMAVVFDRGLRVSTREVADYVAALAQNTALAANEATEYATQIGRALRLFGTGSGGQAAQITGVVGELAGRIKELGGNSQVVVDVYKRLASASTEGFMLRGVTGTRAGSLNSAKGATDALENVGRSLRRLVTANPQRQLELYLLQLEQAGQVHNMSAADVRDYLEALEMQRKTLNTNNALQEAYNKQSLLTGEALGQLWSAFRSLYQQALLPIMRVLTPLIKVGTDFLRWLLDTKIAVPLTVGAVTVATLTLSAALVKLTKSLLTSAASATAFGTFMDMTGLKGLASGGGRLATISGTLLQVGKSLLRLVPGVGWGIAIGGALTFVLQKFFPGNWIQTLTRSWADAMYAQKEKPSYGARNRLFASDGPLEQAIKAMATAQNSGAARTAVLDIARKSALSGVKPEAFLERVSVEFEKRFRDAHFVKQLTRHTVHTDEHYADDQEAERALADKLAMLKNNEILGDLKTILERQARGAALRAERDALQQQMDATAAMGAVFAPSRFTGSSWFDSPFMQNFGGR